MANFKFLILKKKGLLIRLIAFLVLDFHLDFINGITRLHLKGYGFSRRNIHKDLHGRHMGNKEQQCDKNLSGIVVHTQ